MKKLLNKREVAELLNISINSIPRLQRRVPFIRVGRRVLFDPDDVARYIEASRVIPRHRVGAEGA